MRRLLFIGLLELCMLAGCADTASDQPQTTSFFAMDTVMDFTIYGDKALLTGAEALISDLEETVSVTDKGSELYEINETGTGMLTGSAGELMQSALAMVPPYRRRFGYFNLSGRAGLGLYYGELSGAGGRHPWGAAGPCGLHKDPV